MIGVVHPLHSHVNVHCPQVPPIAKTQDCWMGIDEAGRGPVCGPMTYGICYGPISGEKRLKGMGFMDSKQLSEDVREKLFKKIKEAEDFIGWSVAVLSPQDISGHMLGRIQYNLNAMSHDCAIGMVHRVIAQGTTCTTVPSRCSLVRVHVCIHVHVSFRRTAHLNPNSVSVYMVGATFPGVQLTELYVDTVGKEEFYQEKLERIFPQLKIVVTSKADVKFPIVSAASICAKVAHCRDSAQSHGVRLCLSHAASDGTAHVVYHLSTHNITSSCA